MQIKITNKIEHKVEEFQNKYGATKTWIASQMSMTPQNMYQIFRSNNISLETLIKFSITLNCHMSDLYEFEVVD